MKSSFNDILSLLSIKKYVYKVRQKVFIFIFFLGASFLFWVLNSLNNVFSVTISYPAEYINYPKNKVLVSAMPPMIDLSIEGKGYAILRLKMFQKSHPVIFNVRSLFNYQMEKDSVPDSWFLLMKSAKYLIQRQLGSEFIVHDVLPDTLYFNFSEISKRKIAVDVPLTIIPEQQYIVSGRIVVSPDSVIVSGPSKVIDTMKYAYTQPQIFQSIKDSVSVSLDLKNIVYCSFEPSKVNLSIPVDEFTEMTLNVPIRAVNTPSGVYLRTFPASLKVVCHVALCRYHQVKPELFRAEVDYHTYQTSTIQNKLKVELVVSPGFVRLIDYSPKTVDYIIEK